MRQITNILINDFNIKKLGYDFMGYDFVNKSNLDFHHYLVARRDCPYKGLGQGYTYENGVVLNRYSSHPYLHLIERINDLYFYYITSEFKDMKTKGYLDIRNLKEIAEILKEFENQNKNVCDRYGKKLIKEEYTRGRHEFK